MAQHQPGRTGEYERSTPPAASATTPNQPRPVETYDRPARTPRASSVAIAVLVFIVLVILAVLFLR